MKRCFICDWVHPAKVRWDDKSQGFLCEKCRDTINEALYDLENRESPEEGEEFVTLLSDDY